MKRIREETLTFPNSLRPLAEHYISKRLIIFDKDRSIRLDPKWGIPTRNPLPYLVFWFADAFGLEDREVTRRLALGLVYSSLAFAVLDDVIDQESQSTSRNVTLANMYLHRYLATFDDLFDPDSEFWHYLANSIKELMRYLYQDFTFKHEPSIDRSSFDPFSEPFLMESCRSYSVLVMTTLAALAYATNNETKIPLVNKFWNYYAMGHRIYDDLNDLQRDLRMDDFNNSSVLLYALQNIDKKSELNEELVWSMLLSSDFVERIYGAMLGFFKAAREDVSAFNCSYLTRFMDELISSHTRKRDSLLQTGSDFYKELSRILNK